MSEHAVNDETRTKNVFISFGRRDRLPLERPVRLGELGHLDRLIDGDVAEDLGRSARRPLDFEHCDAVGSGEADGLL